MVGSISNNSYNNYNLGYSDNKNTSIYGKDDKAQKVQECQTCKSRKYQDGSDENVSFKSATHLSPTAAQSAVRAHEGEHVTNAFDKAGQKNGRVINASVKIYTSVCPECGRTYVSGGVTNTTIKYSNEENPYMQDFKQKQGVTLRGYNFNVTVQS